MQHISNITHAIRERHSPFDYYYNIITVSGSGALRPTRRIVKDEPHLLPRHIARINGPAAPRCQLRPKHDAVMLSIMQLRL